MSIFLVEASYWIHLQVEVFFWYKRTWLSIIFKNKEWIQNIFCANLSLMTSPGDSGGGCAGEAASLIQVDGTASSLWSCWWSGGMPLIRSNKKVFFLEQFKQEGATLLLMDILMHWAFCMHAHLRLAAAALVQLYHWYAARRLSVPNACDPAKHLGRQKWGFTQQSA